jgi:hypothetical protein
VAPHWSRSECKGRMQGGHKPCRMQAVRGRKEGRRLLQHSKIVRPGASSARQGRSASTICFVSDVVSLMQWAVNGCTTQHVQNTCKAFQSCIDKSNMHTAHISNHVQLLSHTTGQEPLIHTHTHTFTLSELQPLLLFLCCPHRRHHSHNPCSIATTPWQRSCCSRQQAR